MDGRKFLRRFGIAAAALMALAAGMVALFDPFYHFHGPLPGMKAVVTQSEYQCIGTIRNFEYDSVLLGSSTAENYNNRWFDEAFGCTTVKAIKSSGTTADLKFYLDEAFAAHDIKNIFYSLDLFALDGDPEINFVNDSMPLYLYDKNPFNDVKYLFNKDVIFKDIPYLLAMNLSGGYDEGTSYNWWQYKTFSEEETRKHYDRSETVEPMQDASCWKERVDANILILEEYVNGHPGTAFYFLLPPYSQLWWDSVYRSGQLEEYLYARQAAMETLAVYENVRVLDFQVDERIIMELDNYMDPVHFSADINHLMAQEAAKEDSVYLVKEEDIEERAEKMRELAFSIQSSDTAAHKSRYNRP